MTMTPEIVLMALTYPGMPKMLARDTANGFVLIPFDTVFKKCYNKDYESWQYAFINREKGMYKVNFSSYADLMETLFEAKEISYGSYPRDAKPNPLYGLCIEQLKIENDMMRC